MFRNKHLVQIPITYFINQKEKHVSILHNSILTLMKSGAPFSCIDIIYMIYLDVKYFSVVCLSIYYSCFSYIQHVVARNKFTSFIPWKLETLTLFTVKRKFVYEFTTNNNFSLVNKNYYCSVTLLFCYVFPFASKVFVFPLLC